LYCLCVSECPKGETCYNYNLFHYRDYTHKVLAQIRATKGHLPQETAQGDTAETVKRFGCGNEHFSLPCSPPNSNKKLKSDVTRGHPSANQRELFIDELADAGGKDTLTVLLQIGDKKNDETDVRNCNVNGSYSENGKRITANHVTEDPHLEERSNEDLKFCGENLESVDRNCKRNKENFQEQTYAKSFGHECNRELKLSRFFYGNRHINTGGLPGEVELCTGRLHEASGTMSIILQPSESNSCSGEDKLKFPINVDSRYGEEQREMVGIAAMEDAEVGDGMVSLCKCAKNVHVNCTLSQKHTLTSISGLTVMKTRKFYSDAKELDLPYKMCQKGSFGSKNRQTSITSYFKLSCPSSSHSLHVPAEGASKDGKECVQNLPKPSKQSKCLKRDYLELLGFFTLSVIQYSKMWGAQCFRI
jgi:hypothetical protein